MTPVSGHATFGGVTLFKTLRRSPAVSVALVAAAATVTATITIASSILQPRWTWPLQVQSLVDVTAVPDSNWGAPWEPLAGPPGLFQQEALISLVQTLAIVGALVVGVAGLSLGLYWLSWMMAHWHTLAIRSALGAPFRHLFRSGAAPLMGLTVLGALTGLVTGLVVVNALHAVRPASLSHAGALAGPAIGGAAVLTAAVLAALSGAAIALLRRLRGGATGLARLTGDRVTQSRLAVRVQAVLAMLQVAGGVVICAACAIIITATQTRAGSRPQPEADARTLVPMHLVGTQANSGLARSAAYEKLLDTARDRGLSPLNVASPGAWLGLGKRLAARGFCNDCFSGTNFVAVSSAEVRVIAASPGALGTMSTPVMGREFTGGDSVRAARVAVLSDLAAQQLFPRANPVGRTVRLGAGPDTDYTVVGVVRPAVVPGLGSGGDTLPIVYLSLLQHPPTEVEVVIDRGQLGALRAVVDTFATGTPRPALRAPQALLARFIVAGAPLVWFRALLVGLGLGAALLAVGALATLMDATVTSRRRAIALRLAVGARPRHIAAWVLSRTIRIVGLGFLLGATAARAVEEFLRPHLNAGAGGDLSLLASLTAPLGILAVLASLIPALKASRVDPAVIWREPRS